MTAIRERLDSLKNEIGGDVTLVAVSKTFPIQKIIDAYEAGQRDFGENKVQDLIQKATQLEYLKDIRWHFIGHLQSNKINMLLTCPNLKFIHSVDSFSLLEKLLKKELRDIKIFLQVNTSGEREKSGFINKEQLTKAVQLCEERLVGLMTIGPIRTDNFEKDTAQSFEQLVSLRDSLNKNLKLSMGMSSDYKIALKVGTDFIRAGSLLFGNRD